MVRLLTQPARGEPARLVPLDEFRSEAAAFLASTPAPHAPGSDLAALRAARRWQRRRYDAGFGWIDGPVEYGGRGLPTAYAAAYDEIEARHRTADRGPLRPGLTTVATALLEHGSDAVRRLYLPALFRGDVAACPLFHPPGVAADLAVTRVIAAGDGAGWRLDGEVWSTHAPLCDVGLVLARTHWATRPRAGLTMFVLDLDQPDVDVAPSRSGGPALVTLHGAVAGPSIGIPGGGWAVAQAG